MLVMVALLMMMACAQAQPMTVASSADRTSLKDAAPTCDLDRYNVCGAPLEQYGAECAAEPTPEAVRKCLDFFFGGDKIVIYCCPCIQFYADKYKLPGLKIDCGSGPPPSPPSPPSPPPPPPPDVLWAVARAGASCTDACDAGGEVCDGNAWPTTLSEFEDIVEEHDLNCEVIDSKTASASDPMIQNDSTCVRVRVACACACTHDGCIHAARHAGLRE